MAVKRIVERCLETGTYGDRKMKRPAQAKLTPAIRRAILAAAINSNVPRHQRTARMLSKRVWSGSVTVSTRTIRRVLKEGGLRFLRSGTRPYGSAHHNRMRKEFARIGKGLSVAAWINLFFIDETHFETIHRPNRRNTGEWCGDGDEPPADMSVKHPGTVNAAMGISGHGLSEVSLYRGRFNGDRFSSHVADVYAPEMARHEGVTVLMMDNDPSHHSRKGIAACAAARITKCNAPPPPCWLEVCRCPVPAWPWFPAYCPPLSPLEIYFNHLTQRLDQLSERAGRVTALSALERRVRLVHSATTDDYISRLFASMPARCQNMFDHDGERCTY